MQQYYPDWSPRGGGGGGGRGGEGCWSPLLDAPAAGEVICCCVECREGGSGGSKAGVGWGWGREGEI